MERPGGEPSERQPFAPLGNIVNAEKSLVTSIAFQQSIVAFPIRNGLTLQLSNLPPVRSTLRGIVAVLFLLRLSAHAQSLSPFQAYEERTIVTEDPIPISETEGALRAWVISGEGMKKEGANTPIEALRQVPFFVGTTRTENDSMGGDGSASINLYALGSNNVLPLINGRRAFGFSNINAIPISALARIEIVDAGVYGSDSAAGTVNFILLNGPGEKPYEGAEVHALYGNTTDADAHVRQVYLRGGVTGLDGRVSIVAAAEYYSRANLFSRDREISRTGDLFNDAVGLGLGGRNNNSPTFAGRISPTPIFISSSTVTPGLGDARNSPFNPVGIDPNSGANALTSVRYRFQQELGNRRSFYDQDYYRYVAGMNGDFDFKDNSFLSRLGYDTGFVYERSDKVRTDSGDLTRAGL